MATDPIGQKDDSSRLSMRGTSVDVPPGWEVRIRQGAQEPGEVRLPVLHASNAPLPADRADYGGGVVERLGSESVFVALVEFGEESVGSNLFPVVEHLPRVSAQDFHPFQLQRRIVGQAGSQSFFTIAGRAFCLYVVIGSYARRSGLARTANQLIDRLEINPSP